MRGAAGPHFHHAELEYLTGEGRLARLATIGVDGTPHVVPTGFTYNAALGVIEMGGHALERTKKFRDVQRSGRAALVVDDVLPPWRPRGVEVRGRAEVMPGPNARIRLPERVVSWGLESDQIGVRHSRRL